MATSPAKSKRTGAPAPAPEAEQAVEASTAPAAEPQAEAVAFKIPPHRRVIVQPRPKGLSLAARERS